LEYANFEADINISAIFEIRIRMKRLKSSFSASWRIRRMKGVEKGKK